MDVWMFGWRAFDEAGGISCHNLYYSPNGIRVIRSRTMEWSGHVARMEVINDYKILVGKHEGKRQLRSPRRR
jgi:hypothetical protein